MINKIFTDFRSYSTFSVKCSQSELNAMRDIIIREFRNRFQWIPSLFYSHGQLYSNHKKSYAPGMIELKYLYLFLYPGHYMVTFKYYGTDLYKFICVRTPGRVIVPRSMSLIQPLPPELRIIAEFLNADYQEIIHNLVEYNLVYGFAVAVGVAPESFGSGLVRSVLTGLTQIRKFNRRYCEDIESEIEKFNKENGTTFYYDGQFICL